MQINYFYATQWNKRNAIICIQLKIKCKIILLKTLENGLNKSYFMAYQIAYINATKIEWKGYLFWLSAITSKVFLFVAVVSLHFGYIFLCTTFPCLCWFKPLLTLGALVLGPPCLVALPFSLCLNSFGLHCPPWVIRAVDLVASWSSASNSTWRDISAKFWCSRYGSWFVFMLTHESGKGSYYCLHLLLINKDISSNL